MSRGTFTTKDSGPMKMSERFVKLPKDGRPSKVIAQRDMFGRALLTKTPGVVRV